MTAITDIKGVTPTATAKAAAQKTGANVADLMQVAQQHALELRALLSQIIALTPSGDANLTALNSILAELA